MWVSLLLATLAVYRLASLIALEDGPLDLAIRARTAVYGRYGDGHWLARGIACPKCVSFWLSWVAAALLFDNWILSSLGIAGANLLIFQIVGGR